jgi:hypothetical protein
MELTEQLEEILNGCDISLVMDCKYYLIKEFSTLIQKEREGALREFVDWVDREENRGFEDPIRLIQLRKYLSQTKGGKQ